MLDNALDVLYGRMQHVIRHIHTDPCYMSRDVPPANMATSTTPAAHRSAGSARYGAAAALRTSGAAYGSVPQRRFSSRSEPPCLHIQPRLVTNI